MQAAEAQQGSSGRKLLRPASASASLNRGPSASLAAPDMQQYYLQKRQAELVAAQNDAEVAAALMDWQLKRNRAEEEVARRIEARRRPISAGVVRMQSTVRDVFTPLDVRMQSTVRDVFTPLDVRMPPSLHVQPAEASSAPAADADVTHDGASMITSRSAAVFTASPDALDRKPPAHRPLSAAPGRVGPRLQTPVAVPRVGVNGARLPSAEGRRVVVVSGLKRSNGEEPGPTVADSVAALRHIAWGGSDGGPAFPASVLSATSSAPALPRAAAGSSSLHTLAPAALATEYPPSERRREQLSEVERIQVLFKKHNLSISAKTLERCGICARDINSYHGVPKFWTH
jgi:hypothetical protein